MTHHSLVAPVPATEQVLLTDTYGRTARDLRVSLTDRCNLRCTYCMPAEGLEWRPTEETLTTSEINRLIKIAITQLGIWQVRFTGGEPLLYRDLPDIIRFTKSLTTDEGRAPVTAITTNGLGLEHKAEQLKEAGLDRVNVSLDSLDRERYARLARRDRLPSVLAGLAQAKKVGLVPVKVNAVILPGVNEDDIEPLAVYALRNGFQLRFIEQMPIGPPETWKADDLVTAEQILRRLSERFELTPTTQPRGSAPAALWQAKDRREENLAGYIGVIASVTQSFCGDCDRTRLTSDGMMRPCLFSDTETSLKDLLRNDASDEEIADAWRIGMYLKPAGHGINAPFFTPPERTMSEIGG